MSHATSAFKSIFKKALPAVCLSLLVPSVGFSDDVVDVDSETFFEVDVIREQKDKQAALWSWLQDRQADHAIFGEIRAELGEDGRRRLMSGSEAAPNQKYLVGLQVPVTKAVSLGPDALFSKSGRVGIYQLDPQDMIWTTSIESPGASGLRVHFTDMSLPDGAELYLYNDDGQAFGPFTGLGPNGDGDFWSNAIFGEHVWVQVHGAGPQAGTGFVIDEVSHLGPGFEIADTAGAYLKADCSANVSCVENAECYDMDSILSSARRGVAKMVFQENGGSYLCTGGLLSDQDSGYTPWFLTANHCIDSETVANSLETFFQYKSSCGSCSASYVDSVLGADLWATGTGGDFTLLELSELPSSWTMMGWTNAKVTAGTQLYRISHPNGKPQSLSEHSANSDTSNNWISSKATLGATEGGSSGSPVFRSDRKVVGQLRGVTYSGSYDLCDYSTYNNRDGALSAYWKSVKAYLSTQSASMHADSVSAGTATLDLIVTKLYRGKATIKVVDQLGNAVPKVTVTGTFSNGLSGTLSGVTNDSGVATIVHPDLKSSKPSYTFCVTGMSQQYFSTYDASANVATCASR